MEVDPPQSSPRTEAAMAFRTASYPRAPSPVECETFRCTSRGCGHFYSTQARLESHMQLAHGTSQPLATFVCPSQCGSSFVRRSDLQAHFLKHHPQLIARFPAVMRSPSQRAPLRTFPTQAHHHQASAKLSSVNMNALYSMYNSPTSTPTPASMSQDRSQSLTDDALLLLGFQSKPKTAPASAPTPFRPLAAPAARFQAPSPRSHFGNTTLPPVPRFAQGAQQQHPAPQFAMRMGSWGHPAPQSSFFPPAQSNVSSGQGSDPMNMD